MRAARLGLFAQLDRKPEVDAARVVELRGRDAYDPYVEPGDLDAVRGQLGIRTQIRPPEAATDEHGGVGTQPVLVGHEISTRDRRRAERAQKPLADRRGPDAQG